MYKLCNSAKLSYSETIKICGSFKSIEIIFILLYQEMDIVTMQINVLPSWFLVNTIIYALMTMFVVKEFIELIIYHINVSTKIN